MDPVITISRKTPWDELPEYLKPIEVAAYLDIGKSATYTLISSGEIPSRRFGRLIRVPREALARD